MYQSVIRDPGGSALVRVVPNCCNDLHTVTNGSLLIVPPGTTAFVEVNGRLSRGYPSGRYELFTGTSPFFVRLRNILTRGDAGVTVSVFFISTQRTVFEKIGTGVFAFKVPRFEITLNALGSCALSYHICDPLIFLQKMVGSYMSFFSQEDIAPRIQQLIIAPVKQELAGRLSHTEITQFNTRLSDIGNAVRSNIRGRLADIGVGLVTFDILGINVPEEEKNKLNDLERKLSEGRINTDIELDNLMRIYGGQIDRRTMAELMTGIVSRGQGPVQGGGNNAGSANNMMSPLLQMMFLSQLMPSMRDSVSSMMNHTDMFSGNNSNNNSSPQANTSTANSPPPLPPRYLSCPSCNGRINRGARVCPICGYRI